VANDQVVELTVKPQRYIYWWAALSIALVVALGATTLAWASSQQSNRTAHAVQGSCQFFKDLSALPIAPNSTRALLTIIADARIAYTTGECQRSKGVLPPPDVRVVPYLSERRP
jgi:hypothetical protein